MTNRGENIEAMYPLFQEGKGGLRARSESGDTLGFQPREGRSIRPLALFNDWLDDREIPILDDGVNTHRGL